MRIYVDRPPFVYTTSILTRETQEEIYALRVFACDLVAADDLLTARLIDMCAELLEEGIAWKYILDDVSVCGRWRQSSGAIVCIH